jgi:putative endonuclease
MQRVWNHKNKIVEGFTQKYDVDKLVYYEIYDDVQAAILREKQLKKWRRSWKLRLIEKMNPAWNELYDQSEPWLDSRLTACGHYRRRASQL